MTVKKREQKSKKAPKTILETPHHEAVVNGNSVHFFLVKACYESKLKQSKTSTFRENIF